MKVLLDHNVDRRFRRHLPGHECITTRELRWERLDNGALLRAAAAARFAVFLSVDKNLRHQQNLDKLPLPVVVLNSTSNALLALIPFAPHVLKLLERDLQPRLYLVHDGGEVSEHGAPGRIGS